ncbi:hypothetical protein QE152_g39007 [Popillia japonica]|uniref:Uncharacterized protein n=1 Tax=Popillia japonica TaxID=7064 RepID=A0AAW1HUU3_POPJA
MSLAYYLFILKFLPELDERSYKYFIRLVIHFCESVTISCACVTEFLYKKDVYWECGGFLAFGGAVKPPITFDGGNVGVNFGGYHASAGLGGLLGGGAFGGLHAEAGTPYGQTAGAGLGGVVTKGIYIPLEFLKYSVGRFMLAMFWFDKEIYLFQITLVTIL